MLMDHVILRRTFGNYWTVIPAREVREKPNQLRKGISGLQMQPVISKELGQEFANTKAKYRGTSHWDRMLEPSRHRLRRY